MSEADGIFVLDTGSTDDTVKLLRKGGVIVKQKRFSPFRFDVARNESLKLVPIDADLCVCTDLDEVFDKGWRKLLEKHAQGFTRVSYKYVWSVTANGGEGVTFLYDKIHARKGYSWIHPVHEIVTAKIPQNEKRVQIDGIRLVHYPDQTKSRAQYLPLLELATYEAPNDDRCKHYLGREYMFSKNYEKAIATLKSHLLMPSATWQEERSASMRYIAVCYQNLGDDKNAEIWFMRAVAESPHVREPYLFYARFLYSLRRWHATIYFIEKMLQIKDRPLTYVTDPDAYGGLPYDMLSIAYYNVDNIKKATECAKTALTYDNDERIKKNLEFFLSL